LGGLQFVATLGKKFERPCLSGEKMGVVAHACQPSYGGKCKIGRPWFKLSWAKIKTFSPK
jgi:hypothetical protein